MIFCSEVRNIWMKRLLSRPSDLSFRVYWAPLPGPTAADAPFSDGPPAGPATLPGVPTLLGPHGEGVASPAPAAAPSVVAD